MNDNPLNPLVDTTGSEPALPVAAQTNESVLGRCLSLVKRFGSSLVEDHIKVTLIGVGCGALAVIVVLMRQAPSVNIREEFEKLTAGQIQASALLAGIGSLLGALVCLLLVKAFLGHRASLSTTASALDQYSKATYSAIRRLNEIIAPAEELLALQKAFTLSRPWEYMTWIETAAEQYFAKHGSHIGQISLEGTMVGFAFLLPEALRNHYCRAEGRFQKLRLYASDAIVNDRALVYFPLWLVAQFVDQTINNCPRYKSYAGEKDKNHVLTIEIAYRREDTLVAHIVLPSEATSLLALDNLTLMGIIDTDGRLPGARYTNQTPSNEPFDRIKNVIEGHGTFGRKTKETWTLSSILPHLVIDNPHWYLDASGEVHLLRTSDEYDKWIEGTPVNQQRVECEGTGEIHELLEKLLRVLRKDGESAGDIDVLQNKTDAAKKRWREDPIILKGHLMSCPCQRVLGTTGAVAHGSLQKASRARSTPKSRSKKK